MSLNLPKLLYGVIAKSPCNSSRRKPEGRRVGMHRRGKRKNWEAKERSSREIR